MCLSHQVQSHITHNPLLCACAAVCARHFPQVERSVADLGRHGFTLRTLLSPKAARDEQQHAAAAGEQGYPSQAGASHRSGHSRHPLELHAGGPGSCNFNVAQLQGVMALDEIEEIVAQVSNEPTH